MFIYCKINSYITSNFFVFIQCVVKYVAWCASNSVGNCRPVPMYFCNVFLNLKTSWKLKKLFIYFLDGSDIHTAPKYGSCKPYSICDASLSTWTRRSFAPLKQSRQNRRSCVWIEALSGKPIFEAESRILWGLWFLYNPGRSVVFFKICYLEVFGNFTLI